MGSIVGGTLVSIFGSGFLGPTTECLFGSGRASTVILISSSAGICRTPESKAGMVQLSVIVDSIRSAVSVNYLYVLPIQMQHIFPRLVPSDAQAYVTILGSGFTSAEICFCQVGQHISEATFINMSAVSCMIPAGKSGNFTLKLTLNGFEFYESEIPLLRVDQGYVTKLVPTKGVTAGGTVVTAIGSFLENDYSCRFAFITVQATLTSSSILLCFSPSNSVGSVKIEILDLHGLVVFSASYLYCPSQFISFVDPTFGSLDGGTMVQVYGGNIQPAPSCVFSSTVVSAHYVSSSLVFCLSPPSESAALIKLSLVTFDGVHGNSFDFRYDRVPVLDHFEPLSGPASGGNFVTVYGLNFEDTAYILCRFGYNNANVARFVSNDKIICITPPNAPSNISVEISLNGVDFYLLKGSYSFQVQNAISGIFPSSGPIHGNTVLHIYGIFSKGKVGCRIGSVLVIAEYNSMDEIQCRMPPHSSGYAPVKVSSNT